MHGYARCRSASAMPILMMPLFCHSAAGRAAQAMPLLRCRRQLPPFALRDILCRRRCRLSAAAEKMTPAADGCHAPSPYFQQPFHLLRCGRRRTPAICFAPPRRRAAASPSPGAWRRFLFAAMPCFVFASLFRCAAFAAADIFRFSASRQPPYFRRQMPR